MASGTFEAKKPTTPSSIIVYIYDVTNSQLIEPSSISLLSNSTTISDKFSASFQTSATGTQYRLILHCARTSSDPWTLKLDNISVSPSQYVYGTPITDWDNTWTVSSSWGGAISWSGGRKRRVGDIQEIQCFGIVASAPSGNLTITLPTTVDVSKLSGGSITNIETLGNAYLVDVSTTPNNQNALVALNTTTEIRVIINGVS